MSDIAFVTVDPEKLATEHSKRALEWADLNAAADVLEECRKTTLAEIMMSAPGDSMAAKEMHGLASPAYREYLVRMVEARKQANRAKMNLEVWATYVELLRTKTATERAAMTMR